MISTAISVFLIFSLGSSILESAPIGPDFNNINYQHNWTFTWANGSVQGLGAIDDYSDIDAQMAKSLKDAINSAAPGYVAGLTASNSSMVTMPANNSTSSMLSAGSNGTTTASMGSMGSTGSTPLPGAQSTGAPLNLMTPSSQVHRRKRDASSPSPSPSSTSPSSTSAPSTNSTNLTNSTSSTNSTNLTNPQYDASVLSTTQAYGTDEEFYARTDLVHFHVDIDLPEGSGDKPIDMASLG